jgi:hypothetical protein
MDICPVCNGIIDYIKYCPKCKNRMDMLDRVENYYDDYSADLEYDLTDLNDGDPKDICSHICYCPDCKIRQTIGVKYVAE